MKLRKEPAGDTLDELAKELPALLTPAEAGKVLRRSPRTLSRWERQGLIRAVRPAGGDPVYERSEIIRIIREGRDS